MAGCLTFEFYIIIEMKKTVCFIIAVLSMMACAASRTTEEQRRQELALTAQSVRKALDDRYYTIDMTHIRPRRVPTRYLNGGYYLHISGDSIYSCLPYVGRAYNVPYGGGDGLDFDGVVQQYRESRFTDGKGTKIDIVVVNSEDRYRYMLYVGDDGHATLDVFPSSRESVAFDGEMNMGN